MNNNYGKVSIGVVFAIVFVQLAIFGALYWFVLRETPEENPQMSLLPPEGLAPTPTARPPQQQQQAQQPAQQRQTQPPPLSSRDTRDTREARSFGGSDDFVARDYIREFSLFPLGDVIVNPRGAESRFFITTISLEYRQPTRNMNQNLVQEIQAKVSIIRDRLQRYFSGVSLEDLRDVDNREIFKEETMRIINNLLLEGRITDVIFEQWVVQ